MSYQVLARKWRPHSFDQVVGQGHVLRALVNALDSDRLHHAYLFTGTRGVGKTSLARVFAKALNCDNGVSSTPCGECSSCREVDEGRFVDLIEVDAASRTKVDETRDLLDNVQYSPTRGRYKVYLIDEVHMFSTHSFNALLKTLEEPPPHVKFLLATTDPKKLPVTILSRCLQFNLKRITVDQLTERLRLIVDAESVNADDASLDLIAHAADGSVRDSLSLLDQAIAYGAGELRQPEVAVMLGTIGAADVTSIIERLSEDDGAGLITHARELAQSAPDYHHVLGEVLSLLRRIAVYQALGAEAAVLDESSDVVELAARLSPEDCQLFYQIGLIGRRDLSLAPDPQSGFEMVLLRMLAFRPMQVDPGSATSVPKPAPKKAARSIAPAVAKQSSQSTPSNDAPVPKAAPQPTPQPTPPMSAPPAVAAPSAEPNGALSTTEPGDLDWNELVAKLELHGLVRELARNAALKAYNGKIVELLLAPQHENLSGERLVQGLEAALKEQLNTDIRIRLTVEAEVELDTPSKRMSEADKARQREAERVIEADPTIQSLQNQFGATIERVEPK
jgi:DNA polymerase-3 subunit gamma/tau